MEILCISDIHGYADGIQAVKNYITRKQIRTVFLLGDYSIGFKDPNQNRIDAENAVETLNASARIYALPGNCDQKQILQIFQKYGAHLHERLIEIEGMSFIGMGGSNPTPFKTPFEISEEDIYESLSKLFDTAGDAEIGLVTHFPPKDTNCDLIPSGQHVGSTSLRKIIEERQPLINVTSHIHESAGKGDKIGNTRIINVGPLSQGHAVLLNTETKGLTHISI